jgi:hypothetical protein
MGPGAKAVKPLMNYRLLITFGNGERRLFDVAPYLDRGVFRELRDLNLFNSVRVSFDTVEWINGADICPETLYQDSAPTPILDQDAD